MKSKGKKRKKTSLHRMFLWGMLILILIWAGFNGANFILYHKLYNFSQRDLGKNLALLAQTLAGNIPSDWVEALQLDMPELAEKNPTHYLMSLIDEEKVHTIAVLDTSGVILFATDKGLPVGETNPYWASEIGVIKAAALGVPAYGGLRRVGNLYLRVAFAPVFDPLGDISAIVAVEAGANYFGLLATLRKGVWLAGIISGIAIFFIVLVMFLGKRELERLQFHLEKAATLSGIGMMAATLAHEVRNPLAIIKGSAEAIPQTETKGEMDELVQFIDEEVDRLSGIVESHLAVARGREFPKAKQKLSAVVDKVVLRYRMQLKERGIGVIVDMENDPAVPYSFSAIRQVLYNLLENSASATSAGGVIKVILGNKRIDGADYGTIKISDTGRGIPKEQLAHIFEPFHTTKQKGTGLGLFITKQIVEGHGGKISVESEIDVGTIFTVALPME